MTGVEFWFTFLGGVTTGVLLTLGVIWLAAVGEDTARQAERRQLDDLARKDRDRHAANLQRGRR